MIGYVLRVRDTRMPRVAVSTHRDAVEVLERAGEALALAEEGSEITVTIITLLIGERIAA